MENGEYPLDQLPKRKWWKLIFCLFRQVLYVIRTSGPLHLCGYVKSAISERTVADVSYVATLVSR